MEEKLVKTIVAMTPMQREGLRRATNLEGPQDLMYIFVNEALLDSPLVQAWRTVYPGEGLEGATIAEVRQAMEDLPPDAWRLVNEVLFSFMAGNIWDDKPIPIEGGGLKFTFPTGRIEQFIEWVREAAPSVERPSVLDVGCWHGTLICELLQRGFICGGTDVGDGVLLGERVALLKPEDRLRYPGYHRGWAHEVLGTMEPESYHIVVSEQTLEHVPASVLQQTCDGMRRVAKHAILIDVPGWDDGFPFHLRCFTLEDLERLFVRPGWRMEVLLEPAAWQYTTVRVVRT